MRVDIKGDMPITGENIKWVIDNLNEEFIIKAQKKNVDIAD